MKLKFEQTGFRAIVYDADCIQQPGLKLFTPSYWRDVGGVVGEAKGRGIALLLDTEFGPAVLRQYRRGGWAARVSPDRYVFTGFLRTRPIREVRMLARLRESGFPVPRPLGGLATREGLWYRGALLTRRIERAHPLADRLDSLPPGDLAWIEIGRIVRRLHNAGVLHADLNARNILLGDDGSVHLLDFDRARWGARGGHGFRANLERLKRSLVKVWPAGQRERLDASWSRVIRGYEGK